MIDWVRIKTGSWLFFDRFIIGSGEGIGAFQTSYTYNKGEGAFLNGKISAQIKIKHWKSVGAGLICRADSYGSFISLFVAPEEIDSEYVILRLSVFENFEFKPIISLKEKIILDSDYNLFELEFISGQINGYLKTSKKTYKINYCIPHIPLPGFSGLIRFYKAGITVRNFRVEKYIFKNEENEMKMRKYNYDVFISHSSQDKEVIEKIVSELNSNGISYWVDHEQILFGDSITNKIEDGLKNSKYILVALSNNLGKSNWCRAEYGPILNREYSGKSSNRVIPLKLDNCSDDDIPLLLYDKRRADYTNKADFKNLISFLKI
jgi:hypothetical protein